MNKLYHLGTIEKRSADDSSRLVEGYAVVFDELSENLGFYEIIHRGAITLELIDNSDILCLFNHNEDKVLARSNKGKGSLNVTVDDYGVKYSFEAPMTALGDELLEYLRRGDIYNSSFAFALDPDDNDCQQWRNDKGLLYRDIYNIAGFFDCSPVWNPAYSATTVSKRSKEAAEAAAKLEAEKLQLNTKLDKYLDDINEYIIK